MDGSLVGHMVGNQNGVRCGRCVVLGNGIGGSNVVVGVVSGFEVPVNRVVHEALTRNYDALKSAFLERVNNNVEVKTDSTDYYMAMPYSFYRYFL